MLLLLFVQVIVLAVFAYVASTSPSGRYVPDTCDYPVCDHDPNLCPGYMVCLFQELPMLVNIEIFTTFYFTGK